MNDRSRISDGFDLEYQITGVLIASLETAHDGLSKRSQSPPASPASPGHGASRACICTPVGRKSCGISCLYLHPCWVKAQVPQPSTRQRCPQVVASTHTTGCSRGWDRASRRLTTSNSGSNSSGLPSPGPPSSSASETIIVLHQNNSNRNASVISTNRSL